MYTVFYLIEVTKDIKKIPANIRKSIKSAIELRIMLHPFSYGKPLRYSWKGHRRIRVGDYRIIYRIIEEKKEVLVVAIKHRKEVYEN